MLGKLVYCKNMQYPMIMKGRGALSNPPVRFHRHSVQYEQAYEPGRSKFIKTTVMAVNARNIVSTNTSPDVPFEQSINMYRGCEHGCIYCFARPTHAFLDMSPGLDFETRLLAKVNAVELLRAKLGRRDYRCKTIALGTNTDPYQPIEKKYRLTRGILKLLLQVRHPVTILTKGQGVLRDLDLLRELAKRKLVRVNISLPTLDSSLKRTLEPRAAGINTRLKAMERLAQAGISTGVMVAPIIPKLNDEDMERILKKASAAGANRAGYVVLRLPGEVRPLFEEWLWRHKPLRAKAVMRQVRAVQGGQIYDSSFGKRQVGSGLMAQMIQRRFQAACRRHGLNTTLRSELDKSQFRPPITLAQMELF